MEKRIWGYVRVSTREQALNSSALDQQCQRLRDAGAIRLFIDIESARGDSRKNLSALLKELPLGNCDEVICTRIDRLARSMSTLHKTIAQFQAANVGVRFLDQDLDIATSHGKLMFNMLGSVAEWESDLLSDRVLHGKEYARSQGKAFGSAPFGYCKDADGRHILNHSSYRDTGKSCAEVARELIEVFLRIGTLRGSLREMNQRYERCDRLPVRNQDYPLTPHGLATYLNNPVLRGHLAYTVKNLQQLFRDNHPPLMSEAEYADVCRISKLAKETRGYKATKGRYAISGLVFCPCGSRCRLRTYNESHADRYLTAKRNKTYRGKPPKYPHYSYATCIRATDVPTLCNRRKSTPVAAIETAIIKSLCDRASDLAIRLSQPQQIPDPPEITKLREQVAAIAHMDNPTIVAARRDLEGQIAALRGDLISQASGQVAKVEQLQAIGSDPEFWRSLPIDKRQWYFRHFVDKVIAADSIEVILSF